MTTPIVYVEDTRPTMHYGTGVPSAALGVDGDVYFDVPGTTIYGPKAAGAWGAGTNLKGAKGDTGDKGETGASGSTAAVPTGTIQPYAGLTLPSGYLWCNGSSVSRTTYSDLFFTLSSTVGTVTMTIATPCVVTYVDHGLVDGDAVYLTTTGALPTGLAVDTTYYVLNATANTFQLAATRGGAAINTTGSQSGTHTCKRAPWGGVTATNFALPDLRGRSPFGVDNFGGSDAGRLAVPNALGSDGGTETHTLVAAEIPSVASATHTHTEGTLQAAAGSANNDTTSHWFNVQTPRAGGRGPTNTGTDYVHFGMVEAAGTNYTVNHWTGVYGTTAAPSATTGGGGAHNNMPPFLLVNWIIKT